MVEITTLGDFSIKINGNDVTEYFSKTKKLLHLLSLLILNRNKPLYIDDICNTIWDDELELDTNKALQNLVYRLRSVFLENNVQNFVIYKNKTYQINDKTPMQLDVYLFEDAYKAASSATISQEERINHMRQVVELYNGEYIFRLITEDKRSLTAVNRYKRLYVETVNNLSEAYMKLKDYESVFPVCDKAIGIEPLEESLYLSFIAAMNAKGMFAQTIRLIEEYQELLYRETGAFMSDNMNVIYKDVKNRDKGAKQDVNHVLSELMEYSILDKAFFCTFDVFKDIFRYETRQTKRRGYKIILILIEIQSTGKEELPIRIMEKAKKCLLECCMLTLRKGDIFANYSKSIITIMIDAGKEVHADSVIGRLDDKFKARFNSEGVKLKFERQASM